MPPIPPNLTRECPEFVLAESGELEEILGTHAVNMEKAGVCKSRHKALVDELARLREALDDETDSN
jgi:hypothetical protein